MIERLVLIFIVVMPLTLFGAAAGPYTRDWLSILYYEKQVGGYKSLADGKDFFLAPGGKEDPEAEYRVALSLARAQDESFREKFPLRYKRLAAAHGLPYCPIVVPDSRFKVVYLVYPNRYMRNPASMFGHLLLVLCPDEGLNDADILHYVVETRGQSPVLYLPKTFSGGFEGRFLTEPYFKKIKEYLYVDDREVQYYKLDLTPAQIDDLLLHAVELRQTHFDYYFLDENCGFFIGKLLNVVLGEDVYQSDPVVLPSDVVRDLGKKGYLTIELFRRASTSEFNERYALLAGREQRQVVELLTQEDAPLPENPEVLRTFILISEHVLNNNSDLTQTIRLNRIRAYGYLREIGQAEVRTGFQERDVVAPGRSRVLEAERGPGGLFLLGYAPITYRSRYTLESLDEKDMTVMSTRLLLDPDGPDQIDATLLELSNQILSNRILPSGSWRVKSMFGWRESLLCYQSADLGRSVAVLPRLHASGYAGLTLANYAPLSEEPLDDLRLRPLVRLALSALPVPGRCAVYGEYRYELSRHGLRAGMQFSAGGFGYRLEGISDDGDTSLRVSVEKWF